MEEDMIVTTSETLLRTDKQEAHSKVLSIT